MENGTFSELQGSIFYILRTNPDVSITDLASKCHRTRQTVYNELKKMRKLYNLQLTATVVPEALGEKIGVIYQLNIKFHRKSYLREHLTNDFKKDPHIVFFTSARGESDVFFIAFYESLNEFMEHERRIREKYSEIIYNLKYTFFETSLIEVFKNYSTKQTSIGKLKIQNSLAPSSEGNEKSENNED